jgi:hypothetical protein
MALTINHQTNDISATSGSMTLDGSAVGGGATAMYGSNLVGGTDAGGGGSGNDMNVVLGKDAAKEAVGLDANVAVGFEAGRFVTEGDFNTSVGQQSGNRFGNAGAYNVAIGSNAMGYGTTASSSCSYNVAVGHQALYQTSNAQSNAALGNSALYAVTTGDYNAAAGGSALTAVTTGIRNTGVGFLAGYTTTTGGNNSSIGNFATPSSATVDNEVTLGNTSITALRCQVTSITSLSDARDKTDIAPIQAGLDFVEHLNPVQFNWNMRDGGKVGIGDTGFIAQDLQQVQQDTGVNIPGLVYDENPEKLEASYGKLVPVLVQAIKDLSDKVNELEAQIK